MIEAWTPKIVFGVVLLVCFPVLLVVYTLGPAPWLYVSSWPNGRIVTYPDAHVVEKGCGQLGSILFFSFCTDVYTTGRTRSPLFGALRQRLGQGGTGI